MQHEILLLGTLKVWYHEIFIFVFLGFSKANLYLVWVEYFLLHVSKVFKGNSVFFPRYILKDLLYN